FAKEYSDRYGFRVTIIGSNGTVYADSDAQGILENHATREEVVRALKGEHVSIKRYSKTMGTYYTYSAVPISNHNFSGVLRISLPLSALNTLNANLYKSVTGTIVLCLIAAAIIAALFTKHLSKPIDDITKAAEKIADGDYRTKIFTNESNQVGRLADSFNRMSENLRGSIAQLTHRNIEFEAMLKSMDSGVIAIDNHDKIIFTNDSFKKLCECSEEIVNQYFYTVIRNSVLFHIISEVREQKNTIMKEGSLERANDKIIRVTATPLIDEADEELGILLILEDITQIRKLERMRRDFVSNVTHELKTPLTSIRGFVDTLKSGALKDEKVAYRFLDIIDIESERLTSLINDILLLSEIESKDDYDILPCNMNALILQVTELLQTKLDGKMIQMKFPSTQVAPFKCNMNRMKQLLINLLDNAIKYTENGTITIDCKQEDEKLVITVEDTGIGMEEEHLERIFERFYRVDKGRSRKMGGTGLGLSIVKHIVELYNGTIQVDSKLGVGTKFTIRFPY
ncbi:MAG TPA: ATP-binding protein, partial [Lachnospiraceae bacterium]|nr:ATP-binding protein [Lachnospiraceae bacterium]